MRFWGLIQRRLLTLFPSYRPERVHARPGAQMAGTARSPVRRHSQGAKRSGGSSGPQPTTARYLGAVDVSSTTSSVTPAV